MIGCRLPDLAAAITREPVDVSEALDQIQRLTGGNGSGRGSAPGVSTGHLVRTWTRLDREEGRVDALLRSGEREPTMISVRWPEPGPDLEVHSGRVARKAGFLFQLFPEDRALPGLETASSPGAVARWLKSVVPDAPLRVTPRVLRYKPGSRCVNHLEVEDSSGWIVKAYTAPSSGAVFEKAQALHRRLGSPPVPRPIAWDGKLELLLMERVPGTDLPRLPRERLTFALRRAGAVLAELHTIDPPTLLPVRTLEEEARRTSTVARKLAAQVPERRDEIRSLGESLAARLQSLKAAEAACHGECDPGQFLLGNGSLWMVDPDNARRAHPASDVGGFLASLPRFVPASAEMTARHAAAFLEAYEAAGASLDREAVVVFRALKSFRTALIQSRRLKPGWERDVAHSLRLSRLPA